MLIECKVKNIVFAGLINVSHFDKYFFIKTEIVTENEILDTSVFDGAGFVQLSCEKYNIIVSPNQLTLHDNFSESSTNELKDIAVKLIKNGEIAMRVQAMGINFHWFMNDGERTMRDISKEHFYTNDISLFTQAFDTSDSLYGVYASKDFLDSRLKLDVKPQAFQENMFSGKATQARTNTMGFQFNFHIEFQDRQTITEAYKHLSNFEKYAKESEKIMSLYK